MDDTTRRQEWHGGQKQTQRERNEEVDVSVFQDIHIRFPGDVYILAAWMAMSDMAKSTATCQPHSTLHGLARNFAMLHGADYSNPLSTEDVMAAFRRHGISGNPILRLGKTQALITQLPTKEFTGVSGAGSLLAAPKVDEQLHAPEPAAKSASSEESSPSAR